MGNNNENQSEKKEKLTAESHSRTLEREKESNMVRKIVLSIISVLVVLLVILGLVGYSYVTSSLKPLDPKSEKKLSVEVPIGSTSKEIAKILEDKKIIKSALVFNYYVKTQNAADFLAGFYEFSPSMTLDTIIKDLQKGGGTDPSKIILIKEGYTLDEIGKAIADSTKFKEKDFMELIQDQEFVNEMHKKYPKLLDSAMAAENVKYRLEGYLFPAVYDFSSNMTLNEIVEKMISKTNEVLYPFYGTINGQAKTVQQVLTVASLLEKEGVTYDDRTKIASVFYNRIKEDMALQTDISVLYALGEHKEFISIKETEVDSPYNLYANKGFGPGPFNSPSLEAIKAALNPADTNYLFFLADTDTGKVYYAETYEEHLVLKEKYIDSKVKK
ncbi:endolytic transglycosylase MltG [Carnobacterium gallinarum]|uniref:endolytic transglycosylase MltG n=1 Tax=Carnobacterium gallinarum TaxID=2749 RepID=UPI0005526701|nr:endolytic transglycosylase MltG [Carnobacterium gallinarum]